MSAVGYVGPTVGGGVLPELVRRNPALALAGLLFVALSGPVWALQIGDPRTLLGVSVWVKPAKFLLSTGVYMVTLAWFFAYAGPRFARSPAGRWTTWAALLGSVFEVGYIGWQASRGEASHFNLDSAFHIAMYAAMGVGAVVLTSAALILGVAIARSDVGLHPSYKWAVVWGLALTFLLGGGLGGYMSAQTGHVVGGAETDAGGLWLFGWSRTAGDLRVAHFFGVHAMHVLPVVGWALARATQRGAGALAAFLFAVAYAAFVVWTFTEALAGRPYFPA